MMFARIGALALLLSACGEPPPTRYNIETGPMNDLMMAQALEAAPGITEECIAALRTRGYQAFNLPLDRCFHMTPPQRWQGLWRNDFEGSKFCPSPARTCPPGGGIWLNLPEGTRPELGQGGLYAVEFVGRRTRDPGLFGHLGMSDHEMIVDRLISIREVEPPPPPPTEAEIAAEGRRCEAAGTCIPNERIAEMQRNSAIAARGTVGQR